MDIGSKMKELREAQGLTRKEAVEKLKALGIDISDKTLYGYESGRNSANADMFLALCKIYNCNNIMETFSSTVEKVLFTNDEWQIIEQYRLLDGQGKEAVDYILKHESERTSTIAGQAARIAELEKSSAQTPIIELQPPHDPNIFVIPYFRGGVSAGTGVFILGNEAEDEIELPDLPQYQDADFAIDVTGKSMEPDFLDGDVALVSQSQEMHLGDVGVFVVNSEAFIKELGNKELISKNNDFPNIPFHDGDNIVCMGKVIGKVEDAG